MTFPRLPRLAWPVDTLCLESFGQDLTEINNRFPFLSIDLGFRVRRKFFKVRCKRFVLEPFQTFFNWKIIDLTLDSNEETNGSFPSLKTSLFFRLRNFSNVGILFKNVKRKKLVKLFANSHFNVCFQIAFLKI